MNGFLRLCELINFPVAPEKTEWGTCISMFLGILLNTITQTVSIPIEKRNKALELLQFVVTSRTVTVFKLQQLTGLLNFLSTAIIPGRTFTRMMYTKYAHVGMKQHYHVNIDSELHSDCRIWIEFLKDDNSLCRPFINFTKTLVAGQIDFYTDTSGALNKGFGCVFGSEWTAEMWNPHFLVRVKPSIEYLELFAVAVSIVLWVER